MKQQDEPDLDHTTTTTADGDSSDDLILGRYKILEEKASTRFSTVFKAFDSKMGRLVAIKVIESTSKATTWAKREARLSAKLNHPNICTIYEYEETPNAHLLIMEYLEGLTLREILDNCDILSCDEAITIAREVCLALEYAHLNYVIHQDIKPENILLLNDGRLKIMDFGTGRLLSHMAKVSKKTVIGTPAYMAPEQVSRERLDDRCDQFSLATVVYEMLSGSSPFEASTVSATIFKVQNSRFSDLSSLNKEVNSELSEVIKKALSKNADDRFPTMTDFRYKLDRAYSPTQTSKKILKSLVGRLNNADAEPKLLASSPAARIGDVIGRIYTKSARFINGVLAVALISGLGFMVFSSISTSYGLVVLLALAIISALVKSYGLLGLGVIIFTTLVLKGLLWPAALLILAGLFWYKAIGRKNYFQIAFSLMAPIFSYFSLHVLFPIFAGLAFSPVKAFFVSLAGSLQVLVLSALWQDKTSLFHSSIIVSQLISWPIASALLSIALKKKTFNRAIVFSLSALIFLVITYVSVGISQNESFDLVLKSASLSLIIVMLALPLIPYDYLKPDARRQTSDASNN